MTGHMNATMPANEQAALDLLAAPDCALFLDFDGTLVDIAPRPDQVVVTPGLLASLAALQGRLDGRLAIVSGRPVAELETGVIVTLDADGTAVVRHDIDDEFA